MRKRRNSIVLDRPVHIQVCVLGMARNRYLAVRTGEAQGIAGPDPIEMWTTPLVAVAG
jgi:hypothetical protein